MRPSTVRILLALAPSLLLAPAASAQAKLLEITPPQPNVAFGAALAALGDVNGDGVPDLAVGSPNDRGSGNELEAGSVRIYDGRTGSPWITVHALTPGAHLGTAVAAAGDVDGDGRSDVLAGAPDDVVAGRPLGRARVFSTATAAPLRTFVGATPGSQFGFAVAGGGDVDGDAVPDFVVGAYLDDRNGVDSGSVYVYSGATGSELHRFDGTGPLARFGRSVAIVGDANGDGFDDVAAGAPTAAPASGANYARLYSGADGAVLHTWTEESVGFSLAATGDLDADGFADVASGEGLWSGPIHYQGRVRVLSGATGATLLEVRGDMTRRNLGISISGVGDANGDGVPDLVVGSEHGESMFDGSGWAYVLSGAGGTTLALIESGEENDYFARAVTGVGDLNGDGLADFAVSAPAFDPAYAAGARVETFLSGCPEPTRYCFAAANSTGIGAQLVHEGGPSIVVDNMELVVRQAPPGMLGTFFYGPGAAQTPFGDGFLCVGGGIVRLGTVQTIPASGTLARAIDFDHAPASTGPGQILPGSTWNFQFWYRDPAGPLGNGFNLSDALSATFCP